jgi:hypothetical protein
MAKGKQWQLIANEFWQHLRNLGNPGQAWQEVHRWWLQSGHSEQSRKSASGAAFERIAQKYVQQLVDANQQLKGQVTIKRWGELENWLKEGILAE